MSNLILYAVPLFLSLIVVELLYERYKGTNYYRLNDSITSLTAGVLSRCINVVKLAVPFTIYLLIYENMALMTWPSSTSNPTLFSILAWVVAFVLYDFCYYWNHRLGHEVNLLWAAHVVHHSSEEYNLSTALRQTSTSFLSTLFYMPLALLGIDPVMLITVGSLNLIYQFWVHTRHIPKLGWFEWVFISPSNHRVHHAQNEIYLDRNYGGVFIIWDRIFGSFQEELDDQEVVYGITSPLKSWNPIKTNFHVYQDLLRDSIRTKNWRHKILIWFKHPGWRPDDVIQDYPIQKTELADFKKFDIELSTLDKFYVSLQYLVTTIIYLMLMINLSSIAVVHQFSLISVIAITGLITGLYMHHHPWSTKLELLRNLGLISYVVYLGNAGVLVSLPYGETIKLVVIALIVMCLVLHAFIVKEYNNSLTVLTS